MDRRTFAQLFAVATGALGFSQAEAVEPDNDRDGRADPAQVDAVNIEDLRQLAKATLDKATYEYISTGSGDEFTLRDNVAALQRLQVVPPLMHGVSRVDMSTTVVGQRIAQPILLAPVAAQRMYHPDGPLAAARAALAEQTIFGVSSSAGSSVEEIAAASKGPKWFQLYTPKDRQVAKSLVQRVEKSGYKAIIVTVDLGEWKDADRRNRFALPKPMLLRHLQDVGFNVNARMSYEELVEFNMGAWRLSLSWEFFDWLRNTTDLPVLIKGVLRPEDAHRAAKIGLNGIVVSNHGEGIHVWVGKATYLPDIDGGEVSYDCTEVRALTDEEAAKVLNLESPWPALWEGNLLGIPEKESDDE
ncbi:MAG: alpha-hydroxy acid oxidase [Pirellulaceae bacterium]|nr:alpha-hydroxy acid oxidase [Pirellulaceae bacterium]